MGTSDERPALIRGVSCHLSDCDVMTGMDEDCDCATRHPDRGRPGWCDLCSPDVCTCPTPVAPDGLSDARKALVG